MLGATRGKAANHELGVLVAAVALPAFAIGASLLGIHLGGLLLPAVAAVGLLLVGARLTVHVPAPVSLPVRAGRPFDGRGRDRAD